MLPAILPKTVTGFRPIMNSIMPRLGGRSGSIPGDPTPARVLPWVGSALTAAKDATLRPRKAPTFSACTIFTEWKTKKKKEGCSFF